MRDLFLLSCFTGLAYADVRRLRREDIERCDTTGWLTKPREKNGRVAVVRLMPEGWYALSGASAFCDSV